MFEAHPSCWLSASLAQEGFPERWVCCVLCAHGNGVESGQCHQEMEEQGAGAVPCQGNGRVQGLAALSPGV